MHSIVNFRTFLILFCFNLPFSSTIVTAQANNEYSLNLPSNAALHDYFTFKGDKSILISGHRGGREKGYPENSLEGFQQVLRQMPAFFEIDPRLTKDSVIVLMHDATLDRTTTGKGKVSDYSWKDLQSVRLKDGDGNVTTYSIPTLEEVIKWSKGRTIINLDKKDVPLEMIAALIKKHKAESHVMLTVHTGAQARYYYDRFPQIMLSAFARNLNEYEDLAISGVPWRNMIAYVGPSINAGNQKVVELLRKKDVRCMISLAPTHDKLATPGERIVKYREEIGKFPDIIESDFPTEVWNALKQLD